MNKLTVENIVEHLKKVALNHSIILENKRYHFFYSFGDDIYPVILEIASISDAVSIRFCNMCPDNGDIEFRRIKTSLICDLAEFLTIDNLYVGSMFWGNAKGSCLYSFKIKMLTVLPLYQTPKEQIKEYDKVIMNMHIEIYDIIEERGTLHNICGYDTIANEGDSTVYIKKGFSYNRMDVPANDVRNVLCELSKVIRYTYNGQEYSTLDEVHEAVQLSALSSVSIGINHTFVWKDDETFIIDEGTENERVHIIDIKYV